MSGVGVGVGAGVGLVGKEVISFVLWWCCEWIWKLLLEGGGVGSVDDVGDAGADEYPLHWCRLPGFTVFFLVVSFVGA